MLSAKVFYWTETFSSRKRYGAFTRCSCVHASRVPRRVNAITPRLTGNRRPGGREIIQRIAIAEWTLSWCMNVSWAVKCAIDGNSPLCPNEWRFLVGTCTSPWCITLDAHSERDAKKRNNCILCHITLKGDREKENLLRTKLLF